MIAGFFPAIEVALQFRVHILSAKQIYQPFGNTLGLVCVICISRIEQGRDWSISSAGQTNQTGGMSRQLFGGDDTLTRFCMFGYMQFHQRDQATEVLVTSAVTD